MSEEEYAQQKALAMQWKAAAPFLRKQRHADIRRQNNAEALESLNSFFRESIKKRKRTKTSGLVEMNRILMRSMDR